ncbi:hypothetical protein MJO28_007369 [Puccinia striiformis f. sp. tritici]|uniref:Uncharacterized protein n=1 Tax=Puccinia striiformis f. sp. tritici TaxID=168172 RepID=A0ACC0EF86_9BASI|nr:hypothetical protein Pst134EA_013481 [Puccinia striiformis f. sp. tritici]KAH9454375.1 hypothetical protein Pst134EB_014461 [Puccinia striiformis f. sp. tritici]KAH9465600.1 hypothetical protein Pst134EA_013481 [Puccinia striiformis f. sp. tritici]KAI7933223.1 hypothetical protein MJO29_016969 [Puccinia striiformis f. sp. tritici]KAI7951685.1 hypothetical protein MJO28_007369 [Puccinia striiformis f. sp. tritici]
MYKHCLKYTKNAPGNERAQAPENVWRIDAIPCTPVSASSNVTTQDKKIDMLTTDFFTLVANVTEIQMASTA